MFESLVRHLLSVCVFGVAFVINPAWLSGCVSSSEDDDVDVDTTAVEAELVGELDDVNAQAAWTFTSDGEDYELLLALTQRKGEDESTASNAKDREHFVSLAHACGTHTFFQSASACVTLYELAIEGTYTLRKLGATPVTIVEDAAVSGVLGQGIGVELELGAENHLRLGKTSAKYELLELRAQDLGTGKLDFDFYVAP